MWIQGANGFELMDGYPKPIAIGKIPIVYAYQEEFETQDVDSLIDRLEVLLSNFADTNDYHAAPKIFIKGELKGFSKKGESGAILEGEDDSDAKYLEWSNAPESVKLEIETLLRMIYTITQTPDISFDSVKGLGAISGIALQLLFMDAHLKVQDKREIFDEYLQRRVNVIKAFVGQFNTKLASDCEELEVEPEITPYMLTSEIDEINKWLAANGNKPLISQKQSIKNAALTTDPDADFEQIQNESAASNYVDTFEPTV
jgi:SPP1 family phage portal protein